MCGKGTVHDRWKSWLMQRDWKGGQELSSLNYWEPPLLPSDHTLPPPPAPAAKQIQVQLKAPSGLHSFVFGPSFPKEPSPSIFNRQLIQNYCIFCVLKPATRCDVRISDDAPCGIMLLHSSIPCSDLFSISFLLFPTFQLNASSSHLRFTHRQLSLESCLQNPSGRLLTRIKAN